ncbi:MAG: WecB/TagA/CpsF family glycosyltransferase [Candidatus Magasanikbacteria bacterium]
MNRVEILGVKIDIVDECRAIELIKDNIDSANQLKVFTPNPEFLVKTQGDKYFCSVLNDAGLNICDGTGLYLASLGKLKRLTGIDLMIGVCRLAFERKEKIFLLGSASEIILIGAIKNLQRQFNGLEIFGEIGPKFDEKIGMSAIDNESIIQKINASGAKILFVAFGMGKQEKWIHENIGKLPGVRVAMGVGGSFDYLSGVIPRAPLIMRRVGLEWVYRLVRQPERLIRILNATIIFSLLLLWQTIKDKKSKFKNNF